MTLVRLASLVGVALLVLVLNVLMSILYMVVYGYVINPGHPKEFYDAHITEAAPYCSIVAGVPLMFLAGLWVAGWSGGPGPIKAALVAWLAYVIIDLSMVLMAGMTLAVVLPCAISLVTKLGAAYAGAAVRVHFAARGELATGGAA